MDGPWDHSYITSSHFWDFWTLLPPYVSMFLDSTKNTQKLAFSDPPPPLLVLTYYMNGPIHETMDI